MRRHVERLIIWTLEAGSGCGRPQALADPPGLEATTVLGEEEVGGGSAPGMGMGALRSAVGGPGVEGGDGHGIEGDVPLGAELAERHPQPGPGRPVVDDAAEFEVETLTDAQSATAQQHDRRASELSSRPATAAMRAASRRERGLAGGVSADEGHRWRTPGAGRAGRPIPIGRTSGRGTPAARPTRQRLLARCTPAAPSSPPPWVMPWVHDEPRLVPEGGPSGCCPERARLSRTASAGPPQPVNP